MDQRLERQTERRYILPSEGVKRDWFRALLSLAILVSGFAAGFLWGWHNSSPRIPRCPYAADVIIGNGEYNSETGYWSEYDCVSESAFGDHNHVN